MGRSDTSLQMADDATPGMKLAAAAAVAVNLWLFSVVADALFTAAYATVRPEKAGGFLYPWLFDYAFFPPSDPPLFAITVVVPLLLVFGNIATATRRALVRTGIYTASSPTA